MKAAILEEFDRPLVVEEVELLPSGPNHGIVRTSASAFCVTDCMSQHGLLGKLLPTILGHSAVGAVDARPIISGHYALEEINDALAASESRAALSGVIVP